MDYKIVVFSLLVVLSYIIEKVTIKCKSKNNSDLIKSEIVSIIHHIASMWLVFGTFIFQKYFLFHAFVKLLVGVHWIVLESITGRDLCFLTVIYNNYCKLDKNTFFHDLNYHIEGWPYLTFLSFMYDLYFISKGNI